MGRYSQPTIYRVLWTNGEEALLDEWASPVRAVVLDTALHLAQKISKKWQDRVVIWETGEDGNVLRAFADRGKVHWPIMCTPCHGKGKVISSTYTAWGPMQNSTTCTSCGGVGRVPEP